MEIRVEFSQVEELQTSILNKIENRFGHSWKSGSSTRRIALESDEVSENIEFIFDVTLQELF